VPQIFFDGYCEKQKTFTSLHACVNAKDRHFEQPKLTAVLNVCCWCCDYM